MQVSIAFPSDPTIRHPMTFDKELGQGKFKVFLVKSVALNQQYAIKIFSRDFKLREHFSRESKIAANLDHPHIVKYIPIAKHNFRMDIMLMEHMPNGDLVNLITKGHLENEKLVRTYFHQLIDGIDYLHSQGIAHLDLKLDNILLDDNYILKIIDFDQAHTMDERRMASLGTSGYRAPEVRDRSCEDYSAADIYSVGIILFALKASDLPFAESRDGDDKGVGDYDIFLNDNKRFWKDKTQQKGIPKFFTRAFKRLVNGMLNKDPSQRFTIRDVKTSEWYQGPIFVKDELKNIIEKSTLQVENPSEPGFEIRV